MTELIPIMKKPATITELVSGLSDERKEQLFYGYELKKLAKIFEDKELIMTCQTLFENGLNVSLAARRMYMHRNTLIYRLNKIKKLTQLTVTDFYDAMQFNVLYEAYIIMGKRSKRNEKD